jgi:hypothetical protein|tara:strand:+ start:195 stop:1025 length:831 start_codon:yes stop_codon:yes gene_type:complete
MISIPIAVAIDYFKPQISFFQFQHLEVYKDKAQEMAFIPIIKYNHFNEPAVEDVDWHMKLPYKMVNSVYDYIDSDKQWHIPINVFTAAKQIIETLNDDDVVEIMDADLVHLKPHPEYYDHLPYDVVIADATYEDWHMHISKPDSQNRMVISDYLTHSDEGYMNGGFNVIGRVKTIKGIIDDVILYSKLVTEKEKGNQHSWWCAMHGLNIACHNHKIKMIDGGNCYYPNVNTLKEQHYLAHYSCDPMFDKHKILNLNTNQFPNNLFYNQAKKWISQL